MAIYHLSVKPITRADGRSAVAAAAYRSATKMNNNWDGVTYDYSRKGYVEYSNILLPDTAPPNFKIRENLWNSVEQAEKSSRGRLAREIEIALPLELSQEEQIELIESYIKKEFTSDGMCADWSLHNPPVRDDKSRPIDSDGNPTNDISLMTFQNPHAHIMLTVRPLTSSGKWAPKMEKLYICSRDGKEKGFTGKEFEAAKSEGWSKEYRYNTPDGKIWMTDTEGKAKGFTRVDNDPRCDRRGKQNPKLEEWNSASSLKAWRKEWELACNRKLAEAGCSERIDSRSFRGRGENELMPTIHMGPDATAISRRGGSTIHHRDALSDIADINSAILSYNAAVMSKRDDLHQNILYVIDRSERTAIIAANRLSDIYTQIILLYFQQNILETQKNNINENMQSLQSGIDRYNSTKSDSDNTIASIQAQITQLSKSESRKDKEEIQQLQEEIRIQKSQPEILIKRLGLTPEKLKENEKAAEKLSEDIAGIDSKILETEKEIEEKRKEFEIEKEKMPDGYRDMDDILDMGSKAAEEEIIRNAGRDYDKRSLAEAVNKGRKTVNEKGSESRRESTKIGRLQGI